MQTALFRFLNLSLRDVDEVADILFSSVFLKPLFSTTSQLNLSLYSVQNSSFKKSRNTRVPNFFTCSEWKGKDAWVIFPRALLQSETQFRPEF